MLENKSFRFSMLKIVFFIYFNVCWKMWFFLIFFLRSEVNSVISEKMMSVLVIKMILNKIICKFICLRDELINCGKNVMKKIVIFGLVKLLMNFFLKWWCCWMFFVNFNGLFFLWNDWYVKNSRYRMFIIFRIVKVIIDFWKIIDSFIVVKRVCINVFVIDFNMVLMFVLMFEVIFCVIIKIMFCFGIKIMISDMVM